MAVTLIGSEQKTLTNSSQVYQITHDGAGNRLPYMNRVFISFTFGGKAIEDFGLIVSIDGDKLEKPAYANFSDITTTYDTIHGQFYWGSRFEANKLDLVLATDEMTEQQLDDFREWFAPEQERELILSEHPNRAIQARVASAPELSVLPFEKKTSVKINSISYDTSTTVYRGEIKLSFIMDEPHWYGKLNYMPAYINPITLEKLTIEDNDSQKIESLTNKDMRKIILEDGIPYQNNIFDTMFLSNDTLAITSSIVAENGADPNEVPTPPNAKVDFSFIGITTESQNGFNISSENSGYLFYSGTAPSFPIIQFALTPSFDLTTNEIFPGNGAQGLSRYLKVPKNSYAGNNYSFLKIGDLEFLFTTPSIFTGINQALNIFKRASANTSSVELINQITEGVNEYYSRAWAIGCINALGSFTTLTSVNRLALLDNMITFILDRRPDIVASNHEPTSTDIPINEQSFILQLIDGIKKNNVHLLDKAIFTFNSKTGEAIGRFTIRTVRSDGSIVVPNSEDPNDDNIITIEQNVGDMVRSKYLIIEGRNYPDNNGKITSNQCKEITSNENLENVKILFKNMYL